MAVTKRWLMQQQRRTGVEHLVERYQENFENIFEKEDLVKLCCNFGVISTEVKNKLEGLDPDKKRLPSKVRVRYLLQQCNPTFVNLVLIKQKAKSRCDYTIRGDVDDILEGKEVAEYEEIFRKYKKGELVLIEGRPGSGKTTLVHKITQDWAHGKPILLGAKYVFLVTLRHLNYNKRDQSLSGIIEIFYDSES